MLICPNHRYFVALSVFILTLQTNAQPVVDIHSQNANYNELDLNRTPKLASVNETLTQRFPDAIIIGVKKCGTRALLEFLKINPLVKAPGPEVHFFDKNFDKGLDWYRNQMPFTVKNQLTIEKSPAYFVSRQVPQRVHQLNPHMKLLLVVRNPIVRAISDYTQSVTRKKRSIQPTNTFEEMSRCNQTHLNSTRSKWFQKRFSVDGINSSWGAVKIGVYHRFLQQWLHYFPISQFLFIDGERLIKSPADEIRRAERFLGLQPVVTSKDFVTDPIKGFPCVRRVDSKVPHCLGKTKGRAHPKVDKKLIHKLQDFYRPENEKFFRLINQYFHWY
ncbi:Sulfotransfer-1 domain-containing protein [Aphelenchoides bicaudatus]|nr:Sulfotransfer-1 domain-containing protein [Aphelenchoides bicaudatus]